MKAEGWSVSDADLQLPFADLSEKHDQESLTDGLSEQLIDMLTKVPNLGVIARTSSFHFKGSSASVSEIARALNVTYVLEGSIRASGSNLRITAQLIRASDQRNVWSASCNRPKADVFKIQDDIAGAVLRQLRTVFMDLGRIQSTPTSWEAYQTYLAGQFANWHGGPA